MPGPASPIAFAPNTPAQLTGGVGWNSPVINITDASVLNAGKGSIINSSQGYAQSRGAPAQGGYGGGAASVFGDVSANGAPGGAAGAAGGANSNSLATVNISNTDPVLIEAQRLLVARALDTADAATGALDTATTALARTFSDAGTFLNGAVDRIGASLNASARLAIEGVQASSDRQATLFAQSIDSIGDLANNVLGAQSSATGAAFTSARESLAGAIDTVRGSTQPDGGQLAQIIENAMPAVIVGLLGLLLT